MGEGGVYLDIFFGILRGGMKGMGGEGVEKKFGGPNLGQAKSAEISFSLYSEGVGLGGRVEKQIWVRTYIKLNLLRSHFPFMVVGLVGGGGRGGDGYVFGCIFFANFLNIFPLPLYPPPPGGGGGGVRGGMGMKVWEGRVVYIHTHALQTRLVMLC